MNSKLTKILIFGFFVITVGSLGVVFHRFSKSSSNKINSKPVLAKNLIGGVITEHVSIEFYTDSSFTITAKPGISIESTYPSYSNRAVGDWNCVCLTKDCDVALLGDCQLQGGVCDAVEPDPCMCGCALQRTLDPNDLEFDYGEQYFHTAILPDGSKVPIPLKLSNNYNSSDTILKEKIQETFVCSGCTGCKETLQGNIPSCTSCGEGAHGNCTGSLHTEIISGDTR